MFYCATSFCKTNFNYIQVDYSNTWPCCKPILGIAMLNNLDIIIRYNMPDLRVKIDLLGEIGS